MFPPTTTQKILLAGGSVGLLAAASLVVVLGLQNRALKAELSTFRARDLGLPYPGLVVPTFTAKAVGGVAPSDSATKEPV